MVIPLSMYTVSHAIILLIYLYNLVIVKKQDMAFVEADMLGISPVNGTPRVHYRQCLGYSLQTPRLSEMRNYV